MHSCPLWHGKMCREESTFHFMLWEKVKMANRLKASVAVWWFCRWLCSRDLWQESDTTQNHVLILNIILRFHHWPSRSHFSFFSVNPANVTCRPTGVNAAEVCFLSNQFRQRQPELYTWHIGTFEASSTCSMYIWSLWYATGCSILKPHRSPPASKELTESRWEQVYHLHLY